LVPNKNKLDSKTNTNEEELLLNLRGGANNSEIKELMMKIVIIVFSYMFGATEEFEPNSPYYGYQPETCTNPRIPPRLQKNPFDRNNPEEGNFNLSIEKLANSLSPKYQQFQVK
jgi:hypothetical protein